MIDPSEYLRQDPTGSIEPLSPNGQSQVNLSDPYLQPVEGGYYKCTLCPAMLPGPTHVAMHLEGKMHTKKLAYTSFANSEPTHQGYFEQYAKQFFDEEIELTFGVVGHQCAPANHDDEMKCELCETSMYGWDQWLSHFTGKKHMKARRNCTFRLFWQKMDAQYPYYYEHISGLWQLAPPKHGHTIRNGAVVIVPGYSS